jgi:hypothetical protein
MGWRWSDRISADDLEIVGPTSYRLITNWARWVNRRVETITVVSDKTVRITVSIDFRLPLGLPAGLMLDEAMQLVPLFFLERRTALSFFDVRDEDGVSLPLLSRYDNGKITGMVLTQAAQHVLADHAKRGGDLLLPDPTLVSYLAGIPASDRRLSRALLRAVVDRHSNAYSDPRVAEVLLKDDAFLDLLALAAKSSVLHVPLGNEPGRRRVIKLSWDQGWRRSAGPERRARVLVRQKLHGAATAVGTVPWSRWLPQDHVGGAASHHIQFAVPTQLDLIDAQLLTVDPRAGIPSLIDGTTDDIAPPPEWHGDDDPFHRKVGAGSERVHLYIENAAANRVGFVTMGVRAPRHGFLSGAVLVAWLVALILFFFWRNASDVLNRSEIAAAFLLIVPAMIAGFLVRPQEHAVTTRLLRVPRTLTTLVAAVPIGAAGLLAVVSEPQPSMLAQLLFRSSAREADWKLTTGWMLMFVVALALALALSALWVFPRSRSDPGHAVQREGE